MNIVVNPINTLLEIPGNPTPPDAVVGTVETVDKITLRYAMWSSLTVPSKGTVIIASGRAEFIEKYFETITDLRNLGFGVVSFDWRGQGRSSRMLANPKKGYVEDFNQYVIDLETIMEDVVLPDCRPPYYILGHSTGSLIALLAAPGANNKIRRMVLASPLLSLNSLPMSQVNLRRLAGLFKMFGMGENFIDAKKYTLETASFIGNRLTSDSVRFKRNGDLARAEPGLAIGGATISWVHAACTAMDRVWDPEFMASISIPTMLIAAGNDQIVSSDAVEEFGARLRTGAQLTIDGAQHELMQERDTYREQLLACFDAFVPGSEI